MKTLKKSLALVLAVVMVVGVLAVSASAATYPDDAQIQYKEAVEVLSLIGVIQGDDDGNFKPNATLTREQAAKIITYIVNNKGAEALPKTAAFSDVPAGYWSAGYIAYCVSQGIIAGQGDGTFGRTGTLTGAAWAKMLLCALGYNAESEGYVGANWSVNVASKAEELGLTAGINGLNYDAAVTREEACQMAFNALNVDGKGDAHVVKYTTAGQNINVSGSGVDVSITSGAVLDEDTNVTLASKYFSKLDVDAATEDNFGRPTVAYNYGDKDVKVVGEAKATYTTEVNGKTLYNDLGLKKTTEATVYTNGTKNVETIDIVKNDTKEVKLGGNGTLVEVFKDADGDYVITVIESEIGKVNAVKAAKGDEKAYVTLTNGKTFETEDFAKNDMVIYTVADDEIQSMIPAEKVDAVEVSKITGSITSFVADGTTYKLSANVTGTANIDIEATVDLYLDAYGYVIQVDEYTAAASNLVVVVDVDKSGSNTLFSSDTSYYAQVVTTSGEVEVIEIDKDSYEAFDGVAIVGVIETDKEGVYELDDETTGSTNTSVTITKGTVQNTLAKGNSSTIYIVATERNGKTTYTAYTGYKNVPSMTATSGAYYTKNGSNYASIIFVGNATVADDSTSNVLIALGGRHTLNRDSSNSTGYYTYNAVVDGEVTTVNINKSVAEALEGDFVLASKITVSSKGFVTDVTEASTKDYDVYDGKNAGVNFSGDVLEVGPDALTVAADASIFYINGDGEITEIDVDGIGEDENDTAVVVTNNKGEVTALYIFEVED